MLKEISEGEIRKEGWPVTPSSSPGQMRFCCPRTASYAVVAPLVFVTSLALASIGCLVECLAGRGSPNLEQGLLLEKRGMGPQKESPTGLDTRSFSCAREVLNWNAVVYSTLKPFQN